MAGSSLLPPPTQTQLELAAVYEATKVYPDLKPRARPYSRRVAGRKLTAYGELDGADVFVLDLTLPPTLDRIETLCALARLGTDDNGNRPIVVTISNNADVISDEERVMTDLSMLPCISGRVRELSCVFKDIAAVRARNMQLQVAELALENGHEDAPPEESSSEEEDSDDSSEDSVESEEEETLPAHLVEPYDSDEERPPVSVSSSSEEEESSSSSAASDDSDSDSSGSSSSSSSGSSAVRVKRARTESRRGEEGV